MADITAYESTRKANFGKHGIASAPFTFLQLVDYSKKRFTQDPELPNFPKGYLPEMQYLNPNVNRDVFMNTISKTFDIDGSKCIRYILLDKKGNIYEELTQWSQVLPLSFLARVSCSHRNFDPSTLTLDYFVDMTEVQMNNELEFGGTTLSVIDKEITGGYITRNNTKIHIDDRISDFNNHRNEIFIDFFKYDFGSAIKNLKLAD